MSKRLLATLLLSAPGIGALFAQSGTDSTARRLDEVVVTATKYPVKQSRTGKVIIVIPHEELEKSAGKSIGQFLNEQAGLTVNGALNNAGTNQSVFLRGANAGRTLITIDGIPVSDPSSSSNEFDLNLIPVSTIERIEICKGAQSTLYGSDAVAGVINIITTRPDIQNPFNGKASIAGGSYGTYQDHAQAYGKIAGQLTYNVRYARTSTDGFSTAFDSTGKNHFDNDEYRSDVIATNLGWNAGKQLLLKGFVQYSHYKTGLDNGSFSDARNYTNTNKNLMLGGGLVYLLGNTTINANYLYNTGNRNLLRDSINNQTFYKDHYYGKTQYVEVFANSDLGSGFTLLNGADYRYASMNEDGLSGTYSMNFKDTSVSQTSMYSSLVYNSPFGLNVELGGRLNTHSRYGSNYTYTFNPSYLIARNWKLYASVASGFKAPTLFQLYAAYYGNPALQPEKSVNYEGGLQYSTVFVTTRATWFRRRVKDGIDYDYFQNKYFNFNDQVAKGIEWEGRIQLNSMISVSANYTWTKVREQSQSRISYKDSTYQYALRRPEHMANLSLGITPVKNIYVSLSGHYESKRYDIGGYDANFNSLPDVALKEFFLLNAYAEYKPAKGLKLFVDAKNLTNKTFFTIYGYNSIPHLFTGGVAIEL